MMLKLLIVAAIIATILAIFSSEPGKVFLFRVKAIALIILVRILLWLDDLICYSASSISEHLSKQAREFLGEIRDPRNK